MNASPEEVWEVVSDLARMPEFSPELRKAFVVGRPGVGANIIGINRRKAVVWPTTSKVVRWEPARAVAWKIRESGATWVYELEPTEGGTEVTGRRVLPKFTFGTSFLAPVIGGAEGTTPSSPTASRPPWSGSGPPWRASRPSSSPAESAVGEHGGVARGNVAGAV